MSTPADLVRLGKLALEDPTLAEIVATKSRRHSRARHARRTRTSCSARTASTASRPARRMTRRTCSSPPTSRWARRPSRSWACCSAARPRQRCAGDRGAARRVAPGFHEVDAARGRTGSSASYTTPWGDTATARAAERRDGRRLVGHARRRRGRRRPVTLAADGDDGRHGDRHRGRAATSRCRSCSTAPSTIPGTWWRLHEPGRARPGRRRPQS